jgi:hypothetical protein
MNPHVMKKLTLLIWVTVFLSSLYCFSQDTAKLCSPIAPGAVDVYHLPPFSGNLPKDISWMTDWVSIPSSGGWYGQQIENSCRMHIDANFSTWHNKIAVRVEVNPGDDPLALNVNSERAEMAFAQDQSGNMIQESPSSGVQYYATSYYFPAGWLGQQLPWSAFYPTDCSSGSGNQCNSWSAVLQFHGGSFIWGSLNAAQTSIGGAEHYIFNGNIFRTNDSIALGSWTDFVFRIDWGSGSYSIYRRDQG